MNSHISLILSALILGFIQDSKALSNKPTPEPLPISVPPSTTKVLPNSAIEKNFSFAPVVRKVTPAVVSISTVQEVTPLNHPLFDDDFFHFFFGRPRPSLPGNPHFDGAPKAMGSGVIIDPSGIIVTCAHVIQNSKKIKVKLSDNREFDGSVKTIDRNLDLAIIILKDPDLDPGEKLPYIPLGKFSTLEVGDMVLAVGNPFGVGQSVTNGIVSALARNINGRILIQTDASINPGNSGGALVDMSGNLIAIPNAILSKTGGSHGIGFAIPCSVVKPLLHAVRTGGSVQHPWDGLFLQTLTPEKAESFGMKDGRGALIVKIYEGSPGEKAGLSQGDVIRAIDNVPVESAEDYVLKMKDVEIGKPLALKIFGKSGNKEVSLTLTTPPQTPAPEETLLEGRHMLSGVQVANMSPALAMEKGFPIDNVGVVVLNISESLYGPMLGIMPGDIIAKIDGAKVSSVKDLLSMIQKDYRSIMIKRGSKEFTVMRRG